MGHLKKEGADTAQGRDRVETGKAQKSGKARTFRRQFVVKEQYSKKALQLSGKIPALGAGGPGSIPGEALFSRKEKE